MNTTTHGGQCPAVCFLRSASLRERSRVTIRLSFGVLVVAALCRGARIATTILRNGSRNDSGRGRSGGFYIACVVTRPANAVCPYGCKALPCAAVIQIQTMRKAGGIFPRLLLFILRLRPLFRRNAFRRRCWRSFYRASPFWAFLSLLVPSDGLSMPDLQGEYTPTRGFIP